MSHRRLILACAICIAAFGDVANAPARAADPPRSVALLIGISTYEKDGLPDLKYAEDDVRALAAELRKVGFQVTLLLGGEATRAKLERQMGEFIQGLKQLNKDDVALIGFSGHGLQMLVPQDGKLVEDAFFCPADALKTDPATLLSISSLINQLDANSGSSQNLILVDACRDNPAKGAKGIDGSTAERLPNKISILFSSSPGQRSFESAKVQHGVFTYVLLNGLRGEARNRRDEVTWLSLADYVISEVPRQAPTLLDDPLAVQRPNLMGNLVRQPIFSRIEARPQRVAAGPFQRRLARTPNNSEMIVRGLKFLAGQQKPDGRWTLSLAGENDTKADKSPLMQSDTAATGLALMALLGDGSTQTGGKYQANVAAGIGWLVKNQRADGDLYMPADEDSNRSAWLYSHAIASLAVCEAYGMTHDPQLREPAQRAIDFIVASQQADRGGWRYAPGLSSDTSVSAWMTSALVTGKLAGLNVPQAALQGVQRWLDMAQASRENKHLYTYNPFAADTEIQRHGRQATKSMTAAGLLMRLYTGWRPTDAAVAAGADYLQQNLPQIGLARNPERDSYYWYYGSQVMAHVGGQRAQTWNESLQKLLNESQVQTGAMAGSWDPNGPIPDRWGPHAGRLYVTSLNLLCLEADARRLELD